MASGSDQSKLRPPLLPWSAQAWQRWAAAPRMSSASIPRTKFLLIKAPASSLYEQKYGGDRNVFTVPMYAARMMAKKIQVGCVVDCTALDLEAFESIPNTSNKGTVRYFHDTSEWDDFDIDYKRLISSKSEDAAAAAAPASSPSSSPVPASSTVPSHSTVEEFLSLCAAHWSSRPGTHIALFDSRGGYGVAAYLCARYMCENMRAPVHVALASLKEVMKPCGLADATLIRDLQTRYKGRKEWKLESVPSWWWPIEEDDEDDEVHDGNNKPKKRLNPSDELVVVVPPYDTLENGIQEKQRTGEPAERKKKTNDTRQPIVPQLHQVFPGSPKYERAITVVSQLTSYQCKENLPFCQEERLVTADTLPSTLLHRKFKITWISRGRRGLLLILNEGVYFLEKGDGTSPVFVSIVKSGMKFPVPTDLTKFQHRTLLDGVLVHDEDEGGLVPRYYASDILSHMGGILTTKPFAQRIKYLVDGVIMPRKKDTRHDFGKESIKIRAKEYFDVDKLEFVLRDVTRGVTHGSLGVIFVPLEGRYRGGGDKCFLWEKNGNVSEQSLVEHLSSLH